MRCRLWSVLHKHYWQLDDLIRQVEEYVTKISQMDVFSQILDEFPMSTNHVFCSVRVILLDIYSCEQELRNAIWHSLNSID